MKMIFGAVYNRLISGGWNEQAYGVYIPVAWKDSEGKIRYRMTDTHMVENPCWVDKSMKKRLWYLEQANCGETSWMIYMGCNNYYYRNIVDLESDELSESEWKLIGDLHDYRLIDDNEANEYLDEDLISHCPLWHEDYYRWGSGRTGANYVKKIAKKDGYRYYRNALDNYSFGFASDWSLNELEKKCKEALATMTFDYGYKKKVKNTLKQIRKYRKLSKEYKKFCKELNK